MIRWREADLGVFQFPIKHCFEKINEYTVIGLKNKITLFPVCFVR